MHANMKRLRSLAEHSTHDVCWNHTIIELLDASKSKPAMLTSRNPITWTRTLMLLANNLNLCLRMQPVTCKTYRNVQHNQLWGFHLVDRTTRGDPRASNTCGSLCTRSNPSRVVMKTLPIMPPFLETTHTVEILREAGEGGLHVS